MQVDSGPAPDELMVNSVEIDKHIESNSAAIAMARPRPQHQIDETTFEWMATTRPIKITPIATIIIIGTTQHSTNKERDELGSIKLGLINRICVCKHPPSLPPPIPLPPLPLTIDIVIVWCLFPLYRHSDSCGKVFRVK